MVTIAGILAMAIVVTIAVTIAVIIAVSIAMSLNRVISAFHSAMRGGQMCGGGVVRFANRKGFISFNEDDSYLDE